MSRQCAQCSKVWARRLAVLETFLHENLDYNAYSDLFADYLAEVLRTIFRKARRILRRPWRARTPEMNRRLTPRSMKCYATPVY